MRELRGLSMAGGVAIGRAVCIQTRGSEVYRFPLPADGVAAEIARFEEALRLTKQEMQRMHGKVDRDLGDELAAIFEAHLLLLQDGTFTGRVADQIRSERVNAEWAVHRTVEELEARFARLDDAYLRERNEDLRDVGRQLIRMPAGDLAPRALGAGRRHRDRGRRPHPLRRRPPGARGGGGLRRRNRRPHLAHRDHRPLPEPAAGGRAWPASPSSSPTRS